MVRRDARGEARDGAASAPTAHRVPGIPPRSSPCRPLCAVRPCRRWCVSSSDSWCVAVCELSHRRRAIRDVPARSSTSLRARSIIKVHYLLDVQPGRILYCRTKVLIRLLALGDASDCINSFVRQYTYVKNFSTRSFEIRHVTIADSITQRWIRVFRAAARERSAGRLIQLGADISAFSGGFQPQERAVDCKPKIPQSWSGFRRLQVEKTSTSEYCQRGKGVLTPRRGRAVPAYRG